MGKFLIAILLIGFLATHSFSEEGANIQSEIYQIGEIKTSLLEPAEFLDKYGKAWVLLDGRDVTGTEFATLTAMTNIPDARGKFLRMGNNGASGKEFDPDSLRVLGSYQSDAFQRHSHKYTNPQGGSRIGHFSPSGWEGTPNASVSNAGSAVETRPKNILINYYVKIRSCVTADGICL